MWLDKEAFLPCGVCTTCTNSPIGGEGLIRSVRVLDPAKEENINAEKTLISALELVQKHTDTDSIHRLPNPAHPPHLSKGLLLFTGAPILNARMATVSAVLMRGFAQNLTPNCGRKVRGNDQTQHSDVMCSTNKDNNNKTYHHLTSVLHVGQHFFLDLLMWSWKHLRQKLCWQTACAWCSEVIELLVYEHDLIAVVAVVAFVDLPKSTSS